MKYIESLASYVPGLIVDRLIKECDDHVISVVPWRQKYETVCLFCDVSGFTALSEAMALNGKGAEGLAKHLNSYFGQMLRLIASDGGDVFKFAGDAIIVLWPEAQDDMSTTVRRATQCAYAIQENLDKSLMEEGVRLSVKIGIGVGSVSVLHVGGVYGRVEYLAVGEPLIQAFHAEHHAVSGQVICSKEVWNIISDHFIAECTFPDGNVRLNMGERNQIKLVRKTAKMNMLRNSMSDTDPLLESRIKCYVAGAVLPNINRDSPEDEQWGNDTRRCSVMFVNLGLKEQHLLAAAVYDEAMIQVHEVLMTAQRSVYQYEGSINKFLMDDKGSTLIAIFGLPPVSHDDDAIRAVLAALLLCEGLHNLGLVASIGITTGDVFCGVAGGKTRREYTVLGDSVNLAARLMQKANSELGGVLCDLETKLACNSALEFVALDAIQVKGKSLAVKVFRPYPSDEQTPAFGFKKGQNPYTQIHKQQLQNAAVQHSLNSLKHCFALPKAAAVQQDTFRNSLTSIGSHSSQKSIQQPEDTRTSNIGSLARVPSSKQNTLLSEHLKTSAALRTRKSVVRTTLFPSQTKVIAESRPNIVENSSTIENSLHEVGARRGSATSFKIGKPAVNKSPKSSSRPISVRLSDDIFISVHILVPEGLNFESLSSDYNALPALKCEDFADFSELHSIAYNSAFNLGYIPPDTRESDVALNVVGTRFFLPGESFSTKWLLPFIYEAKVGYCDEWKIGQPIELVLTRTQDKRKIQSRLAFAHRKLLESKIRLLSRNVGSVLLLEGDAGTGKSHLISQFVMKTLPNSAPIFVSSASPYSMEAYGPFSVIIQQFLDSRARKHSIASDVDNSRSQHASRTDMLIDILKSDQRILCDGPLLNKFLNTEMGKPRQDASLAEIDEDLENEFEELALLSQAEQTARILRLFFFLMLYIANDRPLVIVIDDAHCLDDESWALILLLHLAITETDDNYKKLFGESKLPDVEIGNPAIMILLSLRPMATNRPIFRGKCQPYEELVKFNDVKVLKLDGLSAEELEEYVLSLLGPNVISFSEQLHKLIESKCSNNPWLIKEIHDILQRIHPPVLVYTNTNDLVFTDDSIVEPNSTHNNNTHTWKGRRGSMFGDANATPSTTDTFHVSLIDGFLFEKVKLSVVLIKHTISNLDRLNCCQQMILKTAARIGHHFKWNFLYNCYPLEGHKYRLKKELNGLISLGYIIEMPSTSSDKDQTFHFVSSLLVDILQKFMLTEQREMILNKISNERNAIEMQTRKLFLDKAMTLMSTGPLKAGILEIQKKVTDSMFKIALKRPLQGGDWKQRYCTITASELAMYRDKIHYTSSPDSPTQTIFFYGASCETEPPNDERKFMFRLDAIQYKKDSTVMSERRRFIFAGESSNDIEDWVYMIKYCIEMDQTGGTRKSPRKSEMLTEDSQKESSAELLLHMKVDGSRNMVLSEVFGSSSCYVECEIGENIVRTPLSFGRARNHTWDKRFVIPITKQSFANDVIVIRLVDKNLNVTDDIVGALEFVLKELPLNEQFESNEDTQWFQLMGKSQSNDVTDFIVVGEIGLSLTITLGHNLLQSVEFNSVENIRQQILDECSNKDQSSQPASNTKENFHVPHRITSITDIKKLLDLASCADVAAVNIPNSNDDGEGKKASKSKLTAAQNLKKLTTQLLNMLRMINEENVEIKPTAQSGSVNKMWILHEIRQLINKHGAVKRRNSSFYADDSQNPFRHIMEQANELDQQHLEWLSSQYTSQTFNSATPTAFSRESSIRTLRRISTELAASNATDAKTRKASFVTRDSPSSQLYAEPPVLNVNADPLNEYYVKNASGEPVGPFPASALYSGYVQGNIHSQVLVAHGSDKSHFYPFAMFEATLRRIVNQNIADWPITFHGSFDENHSIHNFTNWNFDVWRLQNHEILPLSMMIMSSLGLSSGFDISPTKWKSFMGKVEFYMTRHENPYHNFYHITDVMQTCFVFLSSMELFDAFKAHEILALVVGAIVHDLDHPGTNNLYQVNAKTKLAMLYNDNSVLENHHAATAFEITSESSCGIFDGLDPAIFKSVRRIMIAIVLATDMTCHFTLKGDLDSLVSKRFALSDTDIAPELDKELENVPIKISLDDKEREILLKTILHIADISNPAKCWSISKKWSDLVLQEFFDQGDKEKAESLPVSPNMDRTTTLQDELSINFIDFIVAPFFFSLTSVLPVMVDQCNQLLENRNTWHTSLINRLSNKVDASVGMPGAEEVIQKWEKRKSVFASTLQTVTEGAAKGGKRSIGFA